MSIALGITAISSNDNSVTITQNGAIVDLSATGGSVPALTNTHIFVGNASNVATDVAMSGDATITNLGVVTVANQTKNIITVADQTAMLAVTGGVANSTVVSRTDLSGLLFQLTALPASTLGNWRQLGYSAPAVAYTPTGSGTLGAGKFTGGLITSWAQITSPSLTANTVTSVPVTLIATPTYQIATANGLPKITLVSTTADIVLSLAGIITPTVVGGFITAYSVPVFNSSSSTATTATISLEVSGLAT